MGRTVPAAVLLWYRDEGVPPAEVARRERTTVATVVAATRAAGRFEDDLRDVRGWRPPTTPLYGCRPFVRVEPDGTTPECPHRGPIPRGSRLYCERCGASGRDGDPRLDRDAATEPAPEPRLPEPKRRRPSRRERRAS